LSVVQGITSREEDTMSDIQIWREGLAEVAEDEIVPSGTLVPQSQIVDLHSLKVFLSRLHELWDRDADAGHSINDDLRDRVLVLISRGHPQSAELAQAVLVTDQWDVSSWTA
jgi:hypothetical protein